MNRILLFLIGALLLVSGICDASDIIIKKGISFVSARKILLLDHWEPQQSKRQTERFPIDKMLYRQKIIEVDICSVDSFCIFRYKKNGDCLKLVAHGEKLEDLKVTGWDFSCPDDY